LGKSLQVGLLVEPRSPAIFKFGKHCAGNASGKQLRRGRLQAGLGWRRIGVEAFQRFAPPGQADRAQRRLGRSSDHFGQRVINIEQRIEGRTELGRPIEPNEIAIPLRLSDR